MELQLSVVGLVVADMAATLAFYRRLGLEIPADADTQAHVEVEVAGLRLAFDTEDVIRSYDPGYTRPQGSQRVALAFSCRTPGEVDAAYAELTAAGAEAAISPWDAAWDALRRRPRPRRHTGRPVRLTAGLTHLAAGWASSR